MAGFEVVVRPAVLPNIRPAPARVLPPQDDPEQGIAVLGGSGGSPIDLPYSFSFSYSSQVQVMQETRRQFSKERVYQTDGRGNVNKSNYVDIERLSKVRMDTERGSELLMFAEPPKVDNVETIDRDLVRDST